MPGVVAFHSGHLLLLARKAYERSLADRMYALEAILLSAIALECFVNELEELFTKPLFRASESQLGKVAGTLRLLEELRAPLMDKLDGLHLSLVGIRIDRGRRMTQDVALLVRLRNALVHRRAESFEWEPDGTGTYEHHQFVKQLAQRGVIPNPAAGSPSAWSQHCLVPSTAQWAHDVAVGAANELVAWIPEGEFKKSVWFHCSEWKPIAS
jgi:hypothetical protein